MNKGFVVKYVSEDCGSSHYAQPSDCRYVTSAVLSYHSKISPPFRNRGALRGMAAQFVGLPLLSWRGCQRQPKQSSGGGMRLTHSLQLLAITAENNLMNQATIEMPEAQRKINLNSLCS